jgi:hypothetical protein
LSFSRKIQRPPPGKRFFFPYAYFDPQRIFHVWSIAENKGRCGKQLKYDATMWF